MIEVKRSSMQIVNILSQLSSVLENKTEQKIVFKHVVFYFAMYLISLSFGRVYLWLFPDLYLAVYSVNFVTNCQLSLNFSAGCTMYNVHCTNDNSVKYS